VVANALHRANGETGRERARTAPRLAGSFAIASPAQGADMKASYRRAAIGVALTPIVGCATDMPTGVPTISPPAAANRAAGSLGCQSVVFTSEISGTFPSFSGTMAGDLEGTLQILQDPSTIVAPNDIYARVDGTFEFQVSGGTIPALVGQSFRAATTGWNRFAPDVDPTLGEVGGRAREIEGVRKANLTFHGFVDVTDGAPPFEVRLSWHGVICP
jgi:hypothetical protein